MPRRRALPPALLAVLCAALVAVASAEAATWVVKGRGYGHGVGLSQYGAYGYAKHGRGYRGILDHYYRRTKIRREGGRQIDVLLDRSQGRVRFEGAGRACGKGLRPAKTYRFADSGPDVILRSAGGRKLKNCGKEGSARGGKDVHVFKEGVFRGELVARSRSGGVMVLNSVGLEGYVKGVVPNEMPSSWPGQALRSQAVAARSYGLATRKSGRFDHYDDVRSQVYGGRRSETKATNRAVRGTDGEVLKHDGAIAVTYFFSTSGGQTENSEFGFAGGSSVPYLKSVNDPYDDISPYHRWRLSFSQGEMESRLAGLFSGRLRKVDVTKRGRSPRIVEARVVGSSSSSQVDGALLRSRLGARSTWMRFLKR